MGKKPKHNGGRNILKVIKALTTPTVTVGCNHRNLPVPVSIYNESALNYLERQRALKRGVHLFDCRVQISISLTKTKDFIFNPLNPRLVTDFLELFWFFFSC